MSTNRNIAAERAKLRNEKRDNSKRLQELADQCRDHSDPEVKDLSGKITSLIAFIDAKKSTAQANMEQIRELGTGISRLAQTKNYHEGKGIIDNLQTCLASRLILETSAAEVNKAFLAAIQNIKNNQPAEPPKTAAPVPPVSKSAKKTSLDDLISEMDAISPPDEAELRERAEKDRAIAAAAAKMTAEKAAPPTADTALTSDIDKAIGELDELFPPSEDEKRERAKKERETQAELARIAAEKPAQPAADAAPKSSMDKAIDELDELFPPSAEEKRERAEKERDTQAALAKIAAEKAAQQTAVSENTFAGGLSQLQGLIKNLETKYPRLKMAGNLIADGNDPEIDTKLASCKNIIAAILTDDAGDNQKLREIRQRITTLEEQFQNEKNSRVNSSIIEQIEKMPGKMPVPEQSPVAEKQSDEELLSLVREVAANWRDLNKLASQQPAAAPNRNPVATITRPKTEAEKNLENDLKTLRKIAFHFKSNKPWDALGKILTEIKTYVERADIPAIDKSNYITAHLNMDMVNNVVRELVPPAPQTRDEDAAQNQFVTGWQKFQAAMAEMNDIVQDSGKTVAQKQKQMANSLALLDHLKQNLLEPEKSKQAQGFDLQGGFVKEAEQTTRILKNLRSNLQDKADADLNKETSLLTVINSLHRETGKISPADYQKTREHCSKLAQAYNELGSTYIAAGKIREAEIIINEGLKISEGIIPRDDVQTIQSLFVIPDQSLKSSNDMVVNTIEYNAVHSRNIIDKANSYELLGTVYAMQEKPGLAREYFEKALHIYNAIPPSIIESDNAKESAIARLNDKLDKSVVAESTNSRIKQIQYDASFVKLRECQAVLEIYAQKYAKQYHDTPLTELAESVAQLHAILVDPAKSREEKQNALKDSRLEALVGKNGARLKEIEAFNKGIWFDSIKIDLRAALGKLKADFGINPEAAVSRQAEKIPGNINMQQKTTSKQGTVATAKSIARLAKKEIETKTDSLVKFFGKRKRDAHEGHPETERKQSKKS